MLLGDSTPEAVYTFLKEYFHDDHGETETSVVILRNTEPSEEMNAIMRMSAFDTKVFYIKGNPHSFADLKRCQAHSAVCCVIMNDQFCVNPK